MTHYGNLAFYNVCRWGEHRSLTGDNSYVQTWIVSLYIFTTVCLYLTQSPGPCLIRGPHCQPAKWESPQRRLGLLLLTVEFPSPARRVLLNEVNICLEWGVSIIALLFYIGQPGSPWRRLRGESASSPLQPSLRTTRLRTSPSTVQWGSCHRL